MLTPRSEDSPIQSHEYLLRRIHFTRYDPDQCPIVTPGSFEPRCKGNDPDVDGISLFRESCLQFPRDVIAYLTSEKQDENAIVAVSYIAISDIQEMRLSVKMSPHPLDMPNRVPGHVVIPEINSIDYLVSEKKEIIKKVCLRLAVLASKNVRLKPLKCSY